LEKTAMIRRILVLVIALVLLSAISWPASSGAASTPEPNTSGAVTSRLAHILDVAWLAPNGSMQWIEWGQPDGWNRSPDGKAFAISSAGSSDPAGDFTFGSRRADRMNVFWVAPDGAIGSTYWDLARDGELWQKWVEDDINIGDGEPASLTSGITAINRYPSHFDVFWISPDGAVVHAAFDQVDGWRPPARIAPAGAADPGSRVAAVVPLGYPDRMHVFWIANNGAVGSTRWNAGHWNLPSQVAPPGSADIASGLAALARATDRLDVFWIAPDGAVRGRTWFEGEWDSELLPAAPAGSAAPQSGLAAIAPHPHRMEVFWIGPGGAVATTGYTDGDFAWEFAGTVAPSGAARTDTLVAAVARTPGDRDVFWVEPDGDLGTSKWNGETEVWETPVSIAATV
jgi:hypothetical protein